MLAPYLVTLIRSAYLAGQAILEIYQTDFDVTLKSDNSPLTQADERSHQIIENELSKTGIPILSEEGRDIPYTQRKNWKQIWVVDPLDGTKEFIKKNGEFTVNIALVEENRPIFGVVYAPVVGKLYFAKQGLGAYLLTRLNPELLQSDDLDDYLQLSKALPIDNSPKRKYTVIGSRSHGTPELAAFVQAKRKEHGDIQFISAGSSLKFCLVAEGKADCYPRLGPTMEWDTAAGQAVAECAGLDVLKFETSDRLAYNKENLLNPYFIVRKSED